MLAAVVVSVSSTATVNAYVPGFNGFVGASIGGYKLGTAIANAFLGEPKAKQVS